MFESHDSLDHLIGADQHALWDCEAEGLGCLQVDHELELGRLLERDVTRLRALEDLVDETRRAPCRARCVQYVVAARTASASPRSRAIVAKAASKSSGSRASSTMSWTP